MDKGNLWNPRRQGWGYLQRLQVCKGQAAGSGGMQQVPRRVSRGMHRGTWARKARGVCRTTAAACAGAASARRGQWSRILE